MVNDLVAAKRAAKRLLHYSPMFVAAAALSIRAPFAAPSLKFPAAVARKER